jgi:hypothetical protein
MNRAMAVYRMRRHDVGRRKWKACARSASAEGFGSGDPNEPFGASQPEKTSASLGIHQLLEEILGADGGRLPGATTEPGSHCGGEDPGNGSSRQSGLRKRLRAEEWWRQFTPRTCSIHEVGVHRKHYPVMVSWTVRTWRSSSRINLWPQRAAGYETGGRSDPLRSRAASCIAT